MNIDSYTVCTSKFSFLNLLSLLQQERGQRYRILMCTEYVSLFAATRPSLVHADASCYFPAMALFDAVPEIIKPAVKFYRAGVFSWTLFLMILTA